MKIKEKGWFINLFTSKSVIGITLAPFGVYLSKKYLTNKKTINHESIHWKQQMEMLILFFYVWYLTEWFLRIFINGSKAYESISFEREAYQNEENPNYLETRKHYAWIEYLKKKK